MGQPFDREVINIRERPLSSDLDLFESLRQQTLMEILANAVQARFGLGNDTSVIIPAANDAGFFGAGFTVRPGVGLQVQLDTGLGLFNDNTSVSSISGIVGVDDQSVIKPLSLTVPEVISGIPAGDPVNPRIDIVEIAMGRRLINPTSRDILNPATGAFAPNLVNKTLTYNLNGQSTINGIGLINYKTGVPAGVPVAPATDAGYVKIAQIAVPALAAGFAQNEIQDLRKLMFLGGVGRIVAAVQSNSLIRMTAPPGVLAAVFQDAGAVKEDVYIKAGDTSIFNELMLLTNVNQDFVTPTAVGSSGLATLTTVNSTIQTRAAASTPSVALAIGQPIISLTIGGVNAGGPITDTPEFQFQLSFSRN